MKKQRRTEANDKETYENEGEQQRTIESDKVMGETMKKMKKNGGTKEA